MEGPRELYHDEIRKLKEFRAKLDSNSVYKQDLESFSNDYEELVAQTKVITRISDRLQKKLNTANIQIQEQNDEIRTKNKQLQQTIYELTEARVGRKAATIMVSVGLLLFFLEQYFLQPTIEDMVPLTYNFLNIGGLVILFFIVKSLESGLEKYFRKQEQRKILRKEKARK